MELTFSTTRLFHQCHRKMNHFIRLRPLFLVGIFLTVLIPHSDARKILCVGDSITFGYEVSAPYPFRLGLTLPGDEIINAGISGELISEGLNRLPSLLAIHGPTHVLILHGANNVTFFVDNQRNIDELTEMATLCRNAGAIPIIGTVTPHVGPRADRQSHADQLNRLIRWNRTKGGYLVADIALAFGNGDGLMQTDGLHPDDDGMRVIAASFKEMVEVSDVYGIDPVWNETLRTWLYPQDAGRFWSYDYYVVTPDAVPNYSYSSDLGWLFTGSGNEWIYSERFGWISTGSSNGQSFLYSAELKSWLDTLWDGAYVSFDYGRFAPLSGFKRYSMAVFGPSWIDDFGGWILSDRFGWVWADRTQPRKWFYSDREGWLGLDPNGSGHLWSVSRKTWIPPAGGI